MLLLLFLALSAAPARADWPHFNSVQDDLDDPSFGTEDHPSLQFFQGKRLVGASNRDLNIHANDQLRLHFPDHINYPRILVPGTWSNHPAVDVVPSGLHQVVWSRDINANADLFYSSCDDAGLTGTYCTSGSNWSGWTNLSTAFDVGFPHIATDDGIGLVMVAYVARDANNAQRVYVRWKCPTTGWQGPELVRTNANINLHQSILYGHPALVLNREEQIAHLVLIDGMTDPRPELSTAGHLYWYRKEYTCP